MISHDYKCIFVHIPKCGGMSIQDKFLVNRTKPELLLGKNKDLSIGPPRFNHLIASDYVTKNHISQEDYDSYFKFSFVRNPWDRVISLYKYLGYAEIVDFDTFVKKYFEKELWNNPKWFWFVRPQYDYIYNSKDELIIDFLGRMENLDADFKNISQEIGLKDSNLLHINKSSEKSKYNPLFVKTLLAHPLKVFSFLNRSLSKQSQGEYYSKEAKEILFKFYEIDFDTFKYPY